MLHVASEAAWTVTIVSPETAHGIKNQMKNQPKNSTKKRDNHQPFK